jgi:hypothetical protein
LTGLSNRKVIDGTKELEKLGIIMVDKDSTRTKKYTIDYDNLCTEFTSTSELSSQVEPKTSELSSHTKEKNIKKIKDTYSEPSTKCYKFASWFYTDFIPKLNPDSIWTKTRPPIRKGARSLQDFITLIDSPETDTLNDLAKMCRWLKDDNVGYKYYAAGVQRIESLIRDYDKIKMKMKQEKSTQTMYPQLA